MNDSTLPRSACADSMHRLWEYLDSALPGAEAEDIRRHLEECARCRPHSEFERRLLDEVAAAKPEHRDLAGLRDRIAAALATEIRTGLTDA